MTRRTYFVVTQKRDFKPGDRILWRRDHVKQAIRTGKVAAYLGGTMLYAWPDDRNTGAEPDGGTSEVQLADIGYVLVR